MTPLNTILVRPVNGKRYDNTRFAGEVEFYISASQEDHLTTQRFAEVLSVPVDYNGSVKSGDIVVVHHNVFRKYYDMGGKEKSGFGHIIDDIYMVDFDQAYLYKRGDNDFKAIDSFCFIKPDIDKEDCFEGVLTYSNSEIEAMGIGVGDRVLFGQHCNYAFPINGDTLYRMYTKDICLKITE